MIVWAAGIVGANSSDLWTYEAFFGQNLNGDAYTGAPPPTPRAPA